MSYRKRDSRYARGDDHDKVSSQTRVSRPAAWNAGGRRGSHLRLSKPPDGLPGKLPSIAAGRVAAAPVAAPVDRLDSGVMSEPTPHLQWPPGLRRGEDGEWTDDAGLPVTDPETLGRLHALAVPPAWKQVWASRNPQARIQARGIDSRGRVQYRYSQEATQRAAADRFDHMFHFARALPDLRYAVGVQLRRRPPQPDFEQMTALAVRLLDLGLFRVGSTRYERDNHTYGLTTLHTGQVRVRGRRIDFDFVGKEHVRQVHTIEDALAARVTARRLKQVADERVVEPLLQGGGQTTRRVTSSTVNTYIHAATGSAGSAKVFRTWGATVIAAAVMGGASSPTKAKHRDSTLHAFDAAAAVLGNTPSMARNSYVHPKALVVGTHTQMQDAVQAAAQRAGTDRVERIFVDPDLQATVLELLEAEL